MGKMVDVLDESPLTKEILYLIPPPLPSRPTTSYKQNGLLINRALHGGHCSVSNATRDLWDRMFDEAYGADVVIHTDHGGKIYGHASILGMSSQILKNMLKKSNGRNRKQSISIRGVPHDAVRVFIRYLYSSCYDTEDMEEFALHLLVLSHAYTIPHLKRECERHIEKGQINIENVVDVFQLALLCDAPRLSFVCHRMILNNLKAVTATDGWKVMKESHPMLEREISRLIIDTENRKKERLSKLKERKMYLQLYEAMEALVHICRDGCRTIGPYDKLPKQDQEPCGYAACKGLELLVRHFAACKLRVPGGCIHCKRMWQLLELHARLCADSDACGVPLCRNFKYRSKKQNKKDEMKWKILAKKILRSKSISGAPYFSIVSSSS
ncbi:BTB/POZ and TAZ domain-containing protein [Drosera capensis]